MKIALLFPGQGAQHVGMGADVAAVFPKAAEVYAAANDIVGFDLTRVCFEGPEDDLNTTALSQPAIFATCAAILEVLRSEGAEEVSQASVTAGLSMGEYTALYAAGVLEFGEALRLVQKRGAAMQAAAEVNGGSMVSIIGLDEEKVNELCAEAGQGELLAPVNFNCPGQIVVSGTADACTRAEQLAEEYGAIKAVRLAVAGAFHTEAMDPAASALGQALESSSLAEPGSIRTVANITAEYYGSAEAIKQGLVEQLTGAILWQRCMERLLADGVERFYEIGPGRVLTGLMRRIHRRAEVINVSNLASLNAVLGRQ